MASDNDLYQPSRSNIHPRLRGRTYDTCALTRRRRNDERVEDDDDATTTHSTSNATSSSTATARPGSAAFADSDVNALATVFADFATIKSDGSMCIDMNGARRLLESIGERPDESSLRELFRSADHADVGEIGLQGFLSASDHVLNRPVQIIIVVGGPASGKTILCNRLAQDCSVEHLCAADLLRDEVNKGTPLGKEIASLQSRGSTVPGAIILALVRRRMREHPNRRALLTGFPRNQQDAEDFCDIIGRPELAISLDCTDTILMERELQRTDSKASGDVDEAIQKLRSFRKQHKATVSLLQEQHVPIVNLDSSGSTDNVWQQLLAIGRLMRPASSKGEATAHWLA